MTVKLGQRVRLTIRRCGSWDFDYQKFTRRRTRTFAYRLWVGPLYAALYNY